jgi:hypothetical protein
VEISLPLGQVADAVHLVREGGRRDDLDLTGQLIVQEYQRFACRRPRGGVYKVDQNVQVDGGGQECLLHRDGEQVRMSVVTPPDGQPATVRRAPSLLAARGESQRLPHTVQPVVAPARDPDAEAAGVPCADLRHQVACHATAPLAPIYAQMSEADYLAGQPVERIANEVTSPSRDQKRAGRGGLGEYREGQLTERTDRLAR